MDEDTIIRLAREAGLEIFSLYGQDEVGCGDGYHIQTPLIERFAALVAAHEREKQQATIDFLTRAYDILKKEVDELHQAQRDQIAAAIRSRT